MLAACQTAKPAFDLSTLRATAEDADSVTLTGWLDQPNMLLYDTEAALRARDPAHCIPIRALSMAGIVTPEYDGRQMAVTGSLIDTPAQPCSVRVTILASDISMP
jgi:hypothetical protein